MASFRNEIKVSSDQKQRNQKEVLTRKKVQVGKDQEKAQSESSHSKKGTSRQRSGKGAIRKKFKLEKKVQVGKGQKQRNQKEVLTRKKVQVGKDQEKAQSERSSHSKKGTSRQRSGKGAIRRRFPLQKRRWEKHIVSRMSSYFPKRWPLSYLNLTKNMKTYEGDPRSKYANASLISFTVVMFQNIQSDIS